MTRGPWWASVFGMLRTLAVLALTLALVLVPAVPASADVTAEFALGILTVNGDGRANTIAVTCDNGNVKVNGEAPSGGRVHCSNVRSVLVRAGDGPDRIVLSDLGRPSFDILLEIAVFGEAGNDTLIGSPLGDHLYGGGGVDTLRGGDGFDKLFPGGGGGVVVGGSGKDRVAVSGAGGWLVNDRRILHAEGSEVTKLQGVEIVAVQGGSGDDTITGVAFSGSMLVDGGDGDDQIRTGSGRDHLLGRAGDDLLISGPGDDLLEGGKGKDDLHGGDGDDQLLGGPGDDSCAGGAGADSLNSC